MRSKYALNYIPFGPRALLINWPASICPEILIDIVALKSTLVHEAILEHVVAYHSLTLIFHQAQDSFDFWINYVDEQYQQAKKNPKIEPNIHNIPVCYDPELGSDLVALSKEKKMSTVELIREHSARKYLVYFIGFQPGFVYLGGLNPKLHTPRKSTPSKHVAKGSVAIGGAQTGIYPADAPGGWHVIGRTYLNLFNPSHTLACKYKSGDFIEFTPISRTEFDLNLEKIQGSANEIKRRKDDAVFKLLKSGIYSSIQDLGRRGYRALGVVQSGAMDQISARLANSLVGNSPSEAVLEITYGGLQLECLSSCNIVLCGADFSSKKNNLPLEMNKVIGLRRGDLITMGQRKNGARTYVAIEFGFDTELIMGSRSYYGPVTGKKRLKDGDLLYQSKNQICSSEVPKIQPTVESCGLSKAFDLSHLGKLIDFSISKTIVLTASPGPEYNTLKDSIKKSIYQEFTIGANDRMGYLLIERIQNDCPPIYSSAVLPGTVQLTPSGQLIVLANDGQVTGGYPRVLLVSDQSMCQLSQLISGQKIRFKILSIN